jgi:uncharacterized repeat protein (TIGR01451 family)
MMDEGFLMTMLTARVPGGRRALAALFGCFCILGAAFTPNSAHAAARNFSVRYQTDAKGSITLIGNTNESCTQGAQAPPATCAASVPVSGTGAAGGNLNDNGYNMAYVNTAGGTINSSSAVFTKPVGATILFAGLYWSGEETGGAGGAAPASAAYNTVKFLTPASATYTTLTADVLDQNTGVDGAPALAFSGFKNVTAQVQAGGSGTYAVADINAATGANRYAGWALILVISDPAQPLRDLTVFDGYITVAGTSVNNTITGFRTPLTGAFTVQMGAVAFDGDLGSTGDAMQLNGVTISNATNPANNFYNSSISLLGTNFANRNPNFVNTLGVDEDIIDISGILANGATSATLTFVGAAGDTYFPDVLTFATDIYQPDFSSASGFTKNVAKVAGSAGGTILAGDTLEYTLLMTNTGNDGTTNMVLSDSIPANTTYVPSSLQITTGANLGAKTDVSGDDQAEFTGSSVVFRLGTGATSSVGGNIPPNGSTTVKFRVLVNAGTPATTVLSNQASIAYKSATLGTPFTQLSDGDPNTPGAQPTTVIVGAAPVANLSLTKSGTPDPVVPGQNITYTLTVNNTGPAAASTVTLTDAVPTNTTFVSATAPAGWTPATPAVGATGTMTFTNASLAVGTYTITIVVKVDAAMTATSIGNSATISSPTDPTGPHTASTSNNVTPAQDLTIAKSAPGAAGQGQQFTYTITVTNPGPLNATTVSVTDPLPANTTFVSAAAPTGWTQTTPTVGTNGTVTFNDASLPPGTYTLTIVAQVTAGVALGTTLTNTATLASPTDSVTTNNTASASTKVTNPGPSIAKSFSPASVATNTATTLTLVITNNSSVAITGVAVTDPLPANLVVSTPTANTNTCGGTLTAAAAATSVALTGGTIPASGNCTITISVQSGMSGTYVNTTGSVTATNTNAGGTGTATLDVAALATAPVTKSFALASVGAGDQSVMTIAFTNPNATSVTGVAFTDTYPAGLTNIATGAVLVSNTCGGTLVAVNSGTSTSLTGGTIPVAGCAIKINVTPATPGSYVNNTGPITEGNAVDNPGATGTLTATALTAPTVAKSFTPATVVLGGASQMTITLTNPNTIAINNASFTDNYPAGIVNAAAAVLVSNTCGGGASAAANGTSLALAGGTVPASSSCSIVVNVIGVAAGNNVNSTGPISSNNATTATGASGTLAVVVTADLAITKTDGIASAIPGTSNTYTIVVTNNGPNDVTGAAVADTVPLTSATWTCVVVTGPAACTASGTGNIADTVNLANGASIKYVVTGTINAGATGNLINTATVTAPAGVADLGGNNSATDTDTLTPSADLTVTKTASPNGTYLPGGALNYSIVVSNAGPSDVSGVSVTDTIPATVTAGTWTCSAGGTADCDTTTPGSSANGSGNTITLNNVSLPHGTSVTIAVTGTAALSATGSIVNTATATPPGTVTCTTPPCARSGTATNTNGGTPQLSISKVATPSTFAVGQPGIYSLMVSNLNSGTSTTTSGTITVSDPLPAGITATGTPTGTNWNCAASTTTVVTCTTTATLAPGVNAPVINVPVQVTATAAVSNTASVSGGGGDCPGPARCSTTLVTPVNTAKIDVTKSLSDNFVVGVQSTYVITATNNGQAATIAAGTITDTIPAGLTIGTLPGACSLVGPQMISCAINPGIASGGSQSFAIPVTPQASVQNTGVTNTAIANNGGDPTCPGQQHCNGTTTNTVTAPQLQLTKAATPSTFVVNQPASYTLSLKNIGTTATNATVTITDVIPTGLAIGTLPPNCTNPIGQTISCTVAAPVAVNATVTINISVTPDNSLNGLSVTNKAGATGGGDPGCTSAMTVDTLPTRCVGTAMTPVNAPQLTITKTASGTFSVGVPASYTLSVKNTGTAPTSGTITISDIIPGGLTIGLLPAGCTNPTGQQVTCTSSTALALNGIVSFVIPVTPTAAASPSVSNTATTSGGGDPTCPLSTNCTSTISTAVSAPQLQITKSSNGNWTVNQTGATYTLNVKNAGTAATTGVITVRDALPAGITPQWTGTLTSGVWSCTFAGQAVTCTATPNIAINATSSITLPVNVTVAAVAAGSGPSANVINNASGAGGGDPFNGGTAPTPGASCTTLDPATPGHCGTATTTVNALANITIVKSQATPNPVVPGNGVSWTITVTNNGPSEATAVTASDTVPGTVTGLALSGTNAGSCSIAAQVVSCSFGVLANADSRTFTISGTLAATFTGTLANTATAATTTTDPSTPNTSTSSTPSAPSADMSAAITLPATAVAGSTVTGTFACTNLGPSDAANASCVITGLPPGATINCTPTSPVLDLAVNATISCTVSFTAPTSGTVAAAATAGSTTPDPVTGNNIATTSVVITPKADLTVTKTATPTSTYIPGQPLSYSIVVSNAGPSAVSGLVVTDTVPATVTVGTWTCAAGAGADCDTVATGTGATGAGNTITLNNVSIPSGSNVTITVPGTAALSATGSITNNATATPPAAFTCTTPPCARTGTVTNTNGGAQQLKIVKSATPPTFAVGQSGTYSLMVSNIGTTSTAGTITVSDPLPSGIMTTATPIGTGWNCSASTTTNISCTTAAVLLPGGNAPVINAQVTVAVTAASPSTNTATVQGGGDASCPAATAHCASTIDTPVNSAQINVTKSLSGSLVVGVQSTYVITATNNGQAATLAGTISDTIPTGLTIGTLPSGCSPGSGQTISCSISAGIPTGGSVSFSIPVTPQASAIGSAANNTATATGGGDPSCPGADHCAGTTTNTVTAPQLLLTKSATPTTFVVNQPATYTLTLTNKGTAATTAVTTISDVIPGGLTIGTLPANCSAVGQTVTCTVPTSLAINTPVTIDIPVTPTNALNGLSVTNKAGATGGGDPGCTSAMTVDTLPTRCVGTAMTSVDAPRLTLVKTASGTFSVGVPGTYTLTITNTGTAPTSGTISVTDVVPSSLTIGTVSAGCTVTGLQVDCSSTAPIAVNGTLVFTIQITPKANASPSVSNTATAQGGGDPTCPTTTNCTSTISTSVSAPQLQITKSSNGNWTVNQTGATYTLSVKNAGTAATTGVVTVFDTLPGGITPQWTGTLTSGVWSCTFTGQTVTCTATPNIAINATSAITLPVNVTTAAVASGNASANVVNDASAAGGGDPFNGGTTPTPGASCTGLDPATPGHCGTVTTTVTATADVKIAKSFTTPNPAVPGQAATWTITVTNNGPSDATAVTTSDTVPSTVTTLSLAGTDAGSCNIAAQVVSCNFGTIAASDTRTYTISGTLAPTFTGSLSNTATVATTANDPMPGNNSATSTTPSAPSADMQAAITLPPTANAGDTVNGSFSCVNLGPSNAANASCVIAGLPPGATVVCTPNPPVVDLAVGATISCTISFVAPMSGTVSATVTAGSTTPDPNAGNNMATASVAVTPKADLTVTKTSTPNGSYLPNQPLSYSIVVANAGPSDVTGVNVSDTVPSDVTVSTWTCAAGTGADCNTSAGGTGASGTGNAISLANVSIPSGSSVTITVNGTVISSATGAIVNTATATPPAGTTCSAPPCTRTGTATNTNGGTSQVTISKTATPSAFAVGQTGTYSLTVKNTGTTSTAGSITVTDILPTGITTTATPSGTGWNCSASTSTSVTCSTTGVLVPGANAPVISVPVTVAVSAASPSQNTASVSGGGDSSCPADTSHCAATISTPVNDALINVSKTLTGNLIVGVQSNYVITATNNGQAASLAGTITDTIPANLTIGTLTGGCTATGQTVTCPLPAGLGTGASISFTIPVTPQAATNGTSVINTASASDGGDPTCPGASHCDGTVTNTVTAPQLQLTKSATPTTFIVNQPATYTLTLTNTGTADTTATVTITDTIPSGLVIGTLPANCQNPSGQIVTCTVASGLQTNTPVSFNIPVTVQNSLNGVSVTNSAGATGGGDPGCVNGTSNDDLPSRCVGSVTTPVNAPQLTIVKSASVSSFVVGVQASYTLQVTNTGSTATTSAATVTDVIPGTLTIGTLPAACHATGQQVTCTIPTGFATGASVSFVIPVTPTADADGTTLSNTATALGGGDPTCPSSTNCSSTITTPVNAAQLTVQKTASSNNFVVGVPASYTLQVTNTGTAATVDDATLTDIIPGSLTIGALPNGCVASGQTVTCTVLAGLATGNSVNFVIPVTPTASASGTTLSNTLTANGGGDPSCPAASHCASTITTPVDAPQVTVTKTASGPNFVVGVAASYTLKVTNTGTAATTAPTIVTDNVPSGLTLGTLPAGCVNAGQQVTCTVPTGLATNSQVSFVIPVTPTASALGATLTNSASVSGGGDPTCPGAQNCSSSVQTPVNAPSLQVIKTASSNNFVVGVPATYTLQVTNVGSAATTSITTVTDNVPANLTIGTTPAGCTIVGQQVSCTIPTGFATGSPVSFVIPVTPTAAASGTTLINTATVSGGGDPTCPSQTNANCSSTITTPVNAPQIVVKKTAGSANFVVGVPSSYTLTVTNTGTAPTTDVTIVTDDIPSSLTIGTLPADCAQSGQQVTCMVADGLATNAPVSFVIPVTATAAASGSTQTNTATVSGGGDPTCPNANNANCSSTVTTPINAPALQVVKTTSSSSFIVGVAATYTLTVTNVGSTATTQDAFVADDLPSALTPGAMPAGCSIAGHHVTCTIAAGFATNSPISFVIPVTPTAAANGKTLTNTATISGGGDPSCPSATNANCASTISTPVNAPALQLVKTASSSNFVVGTPASYTLTITNVGSAATTAPTIIVDDVPSSLTIGTPINGCVVNGQQVTCTIPTGLATGSPVTFTIPVTPQASGTGTTVSNTATVSGGGDPSCPNQANANCTSTTTTPVSAPALQLVKTASSNAFVIGTAASYTLTVTNIGSASTTADATITDNVPAGLTIGTLPAACHANGQIVTCTVATGLATNTPVSFVIPVTPTAAVSGTIVANNASISGGGDPSCPSQTNTNCSSTVNTPVDAPQLQAQKTASTANFVVGTPASYTLTVTNIGTAATTSLATITDNVPSALTIGTLPAGCTKSGQLVTCSVAAGLAAGGQANFVIPVTPTAAANGKVLANSATVSGGGDPTCPGADNCTSTVNTPVNAAQVQIEKTASTTSFTVGTQASYTLTVSNIGSAATTAPVTVVDSVPSSVTIDNAAGCTIGGQTVTCIVPTGLPAASSVAFTINVTPQAAASGTIIANTATVSGGGDPSCPSQTNPNCTSTITTPVSAPQLQIVKSASDASFTVGTQSTYTLTVTNIGSAPTSAISTISDAVPAGLTIGAAPGCTISGQQVTCSIATGLAAGGTRTFVISVTPTASAAATVVNTANVSGGGDPTCPSQSNPNCSSSVTTPVTGSAPTQSADLSVVKIGPASAMKGGQIVYTITVTNAGPDSAVNTIVDDPAPAGLTFVAAGAPCGAFPCNLGTLISGQSVVIPNVTFTVAANYSGASIMNTANVTSDTPDPTPLNNSSSISTPVAGAPPPVTVVPAPIDAKWMLLMMGLLLATVGVRAARRSR